MKRNKYNHPEEEVSRNEELQLKKVKHKNIIKFHAFVEDDLCWMFVFEYCQHGSLFDMIKKRKTLSEPEIRYIAYQLITTLMFLLEKYIIHWDLSAKNILFTDKMTIKLADFEFAKELKTE